MFDVCLFGVLVVGCCSVVVDADVIKLYVGVILETGSDSPDDMLRSGAAIDLAVEEVNSNILNDSYRLVAINRVFTGGCNATGAPGLFCLVLFCGMYSLIFPS